MHARRDRRASCPPDRPSLEYGGASVTPRTARRPASGATSRWGHYHVQHQVRRGVVSGLPGIREPEHLGRAREDEANGIDGKGWLLVDLDTRRGDAAPVPPPAGSSTSRRSTPTGLAAAELDAAIADRVAAVPGGIAAADRPPRGARRAAAPSRASSTTPRSAPGRPRRCTSTSTCGGRTGSASTGVGAPGRRQTLPELVRDYSATACCPAEIDRERFVRARRGADGAGRDARAGTLMQIHRLRLRQLPPAREHRARVRRRADRHRRTQRGREDHPARGHRLGDVRHAGGPRQPGDASAGAARRPASRVEVELDFALGAHHYRIVRTLSGAELYQDGDGAPIANSIGPVTERVTRLLGMTREEFFNTYFTGQKELAVMAAMTPPERAQFLSRVLGYERLRTRRTGSRTSAPPCARARRAAGGLADPAVARGGGTAAAERLAAAEARRRRRRGSGYGRRIAASRAGPALG